MSLISHSAHLRRAQARLEREVRKRLPGAASDSRGVITELMAPLHRSWERLDQGSFAAIAAINAYFSWLEHVLVLALAFTEVDPSGGTLDEHIGDKWGNKFKHVFDVQERDAGRGLAQTARHRRDLPEHLWPRGFDKQGATIGIHIEGIGAVPARLTDVRPSPHFELYPFGPTSFSDVTTTLDAADRFLRQGPRSLAVQYIEAGLDVPFDRDSWKEFRRAMCSAKHFDEFIERRMNEVDD